MPSAPGGALAVHYRDHVDFDHHVGKAMFVGLERANRPAELNPFIGVLDCPVEACLRPAKRFCGKREPCRRLAGHNGGLSVRAWLCL